MKYENLTEKHLVEIVRLYEEHCGSGRDFRRAMYHEPSIILERLREEEGAEYRIGSRFDGHSKIHFDSDFKGNVEVRFNSNFDSNKRHGKKYKNALKSGELFVHSAMQYLNSQ